MDKNLELKILKVSEKAYKYEQDVGGCAQCVLAAIKEEFGFINDDVFRSGTGFAGGIGLTGDTCGALIGAVIAISTFYGRDYSNFQDMENKRYVTLSIVKEMINKFKDEYGTTKCCDIQYELMGRSFNLWDSSDREDFIEAGGHKDKCPLVCAKSAKWAIELLVEHNLLN